MRVQRCRILAVLVLCLAVPAFSVKPPTVGSGTLTVDNNTTKCPTADGFTDFDKA